MIDEPRRPSLWEVSNLHLHPELHLTLVLLLFQHPGVEAFSPSEEVTDTEDNEEEDLGVMDDQRSIILHLLSQLKLGMDLTRVRARVLVCVCVCVCVSGHEYILINKYPELTNTIYL